MQRESISKLREKRREEAEKSGKKMCECCRNIVEIESFQVGDAIRANCAPCRECLKKYQEENKEKEKERYEIKREKNNDSKQKMCEQCKKSSKSICFEWATSFVWCVRRVEKEQLSGVGTVSSLICMVSNTTQKVVVFLFYSPTTKRRR